MSETKRKIILKTLKALDTIWHPESTLVFKSKNERKVIGRYVDEEMIPLDEQALELCSEWRFKYDESLVDEDTSEAGSPHKKEEEGEEVVEKEEVKSEEVKSEEVKSEEVKSEEVKENSDINLHLKKSSTLLVDIKELTSVYTTSLYEAVAELQKKLLLKEHELKTNNTELLKTVKELSETTEKFEEMKVKFEGIKKLFS